MSPRLTSLVKEMTDGVMFDISQTGWVGPDHRREKQS